MAQLEAMENRVLDTIMTALAAIVVSGSWLSPTAPLLKPAVPIDPIQDTPDLQIFVQHASTVPREGAGMTNYHLVRVTFHIWCVSASPAGGMRALLNLKSDVLRALFGAEGAMQQIATSGTWPGQFQFQHELVKTGVYIGVQELFADIELSHATP